MKIEYIPYTRLQQELPLSGKHIFAHYNEEAIIVYQAFNNTIANYVIAHQKFGGKAYRFERMTWIKPNFLWMMYRSGWAGKPNQERILALSLKHNFFQLLLQNAIHSSFRPAIYTTKENWREQLQASEVRLQWDPDHSPTGEKLERRAIQLGLKGSLMQKMNEEGIIEIQDMTDFVKIQKTKKDKKNWGTLEVPRERLYMELSDKLNKRLGL